MRLAPALVLACIAATFAATPARAATLQTTSGADVVTITGTPDAVTVVSNGVTVLTGPADGLAIDLGDGNDTLTITASVPVTVTDGAGDDRVNGGPAADVFLASPGADTYYGGGGSDLVSYADRDHAVTADNDNIADDGESGEADSVRSDVERITGGSAADVLKGGGAAEILSGGAGDDQLTGNGGNDTLDPGSGDDVLNGGSGTDTVDYSARTAPQTIDLNDLTSVENAIGGAGDDRLIGTGAANRLDGGAGDDSFDGGAGGDTFNGGDGTDMVDYSARTANVYADVDGRSDDGEYNERDKIALDVERLLGGHGADVLTGDDDPNVLDGGDGSDRIYGKAGNDTITAGDGNDTIDGQDGDDVLYAGAGDDRLDGSAGNDRLIAEGGNDVVDADDGNDVLDAGDGNDYLDGDAGNDRLVAGTGNDTLSGDLGDDSLDAGAGNDTADGDSGTDTVAGSTGDDKLYGGDGNDRLTGATGNDTLAGENGNDLLSGDAGNDALRGGSGNDVLAASAGDDDLWGDSGDDLLDGSSGADDLDGGDGNDRLTAGTENDEVNGGGGADLIDGGAGNDVLRGDWGADRLNGSDGNDFVSGGSDDDVLAGGTGADELAGDDGWDTADYSTRTDALTIDLDDQRDDGARGEGDNVRSSIDVVIGGSAGDRITGHGGENYLYGEGGNDRLDGGAGNDRLYGGAGRDTLIGGADPDELDGGSGSDALYARDSRREAIRCGSGRDRATTDSTDMLFRCERAKAGDPTRPTSFDRPRAPGRVKGVRARTGGGGFVAIPGFPGERIDRRLLPDIAYLVRKYHVHINDGYARSGHAEGGEHPLGLAVDIVPGPNGSWSDVDRLARWAEPRQNHPRAPFRWVGYNGDANHGRGNHLHLSWSHSATRPGHVARTVWTLALSRRRTSTSRATASLKALANASNHRLGRRPSVDTGLSSPAPCSGVASLMPIFKGAGRAFGIKWQILAGLTQVESNHGCNMGPSSAGAIGWTQFMPATWRGWGMDADGDGKASPYNAVDAIYSSARYLRASGAPGNYRRALFAYNHANWYVNMVLKAAKNY